MVWLVPVDRGKLLDKHLHKTSEVLEQPQICEDPAK